MHTLQTHGLRWTRLCLASTATALFTSASAGAFASQKHALQPGETLDALARKYHVSVPDLIRANDIEDQNKIPDGKMLTIPAPPRSLKADATLHRAAHIGKDNVSVRLGPGLEYRRAAFAYDGDAVTVTAEQDGWAQITLENGESGWVLQSLLRHNRHADGEQTAANKSEDNSNPAHAPRKPAHHAAMVAVGEDRSRARKVARHSLSAVSATHKRHAQHQEPADGEETSERKVAAHSGKQRHARQNEERIARLEHHAARPRVHHSEDSEPAVSSHKRTAKHSHAEERETKVARVHHRRAGSEEQAANSSRSSHRHHHADEAEVAVVKHSSRHHTAQSAERHVARAEYGSQPRHTSSGEADAPEAGNDIVRTAYGYRGTPYVWGGERPGGFDCSGFTMHLYGKKGISLPHSARAQFGMGKHVEKSGMKPGDLVFFHTVTPGISHVGMYVGNGKFVHASSRRSGGVRVDNIDSGYYSQAFRGARRMRKGDD